MGEINFTPFEEEEAYTATGLSNRFIQLGQQGIDDLTKTAFQDGCLNENHTPSFLSFCGTSEFPAADTVASQIAMLGVAYTSGWSTVSSTQTGLSYWNATTGAGSVVMNYPPNDGVWGPIQDGAANNLMVTLPASVPLGDPQFNDRFGLDALLVMLNVQFERFEFYDSDGDPIDGNSPAGASGAAVCIQVSNDNVNWYHLYLGDSAWVDTTGLASGSAPYRYRVTERRVECFGQEAKTTSLVVSSQNFPSRRDVSIRTIINASSLANTITAQNVKGAISSVRYIRAVVSIIKGKGGDPMHDKTVTARIRKANLSVLALRANEVDPDA